MTVVFRIGVVLVSLYVAPPAVAAKQPPPQPKQRTAALCETVEVAYRKRVAANEAAMGTDSSTYTQSLFAFLSQDPHSNVRRASADEDLNVGSGQGFDAWARGQSPPITFSKQVRRELGEFEDTSFRMSRAPGTDYYVASQVIGTWHCVSTVPFVARDGQARSPSAPLLPDECDGRCGVDWFFGVVDGVTVSVQEFTSNGQPYTQPVFEKEVEISPWNGRSFGKPCAMHFEFEAVAEPAQAAKEGSLLGPSSMNPLCGTLAPHMPRLALALQEDPFTAKRAAIASLPPAKAKDFAAMSALMMHEDGSVEWRESDTPADFRETNPFHLPYAQVGEVYLATVGHLTLGEKTYADWHIQLRRWHPESRQPRELETVCDLHVPLRAGRLLPKSSAAKRPKHP